MLLIQYQFLTWSTAKLHCLRLMKNQYIIDQGFFLFLFLISNEKMLQSMNSFFTQNFFFLKNTVTLTTHWRIFFSSLNNYSFQILSRYLFKQRPCYCTAGNFRFWKEKDQNWSANAITSSDKDSTFIGRQLLENVALIVHTYFYSLRWITNKIPHYGVPAS